MNPSTIKPTSWHYVIHRLLGFNFLDTRFDYDLDRKVLIETNICEYVKQTFYATMSFLVLCAILMFFFTFLIMWPLIAAAVSLIYGTWSWLPEVVIVGGGTTIATIFIFCGGYFINKMNAKYKDWKYRNRKQKQPPSALTIKMKDVVAAIQGKYCIPLKFDTNERI